MLLATNPAGCCCWRGWRHFRSANSAVPELVDLPLPNMRTERRMKLIERRPSAPAPAALAPAAVQRVSRRPKNARRRVSVTAAVSSAAVAAAAAVAVVGASAASVVVPADARCRGAAPEPTPKCCRICCSLPLVDKWRCMLFVDDGLSRKLRGGGGGGGVGANAATASMPMALATSSSSARRRATPLLRSGNVGFVGVVVVVVVVVSGCFCRGLAYSGVVAVRIDASAAAAGLWGGERARTMAGGGGGGRWRGDD